jgi:hypothetical protein
MDDRLIDRTVSSSDRCPGRREIVQAKSLFSRAKRTFLKTILSIASEIVLRIKAVFRFEVFFVFTFDRTSGTGASVPKF